MEDADQSSIEIKALLKQLDPKGHGGHKDRTRRLNRFRNYVSGAAKSTQGKTVTTPEFYDDDLPYLLLGSPDGTTKGLLCACGAPSADHGKDDHQKLKRSARPAMDLLKYLTIDFRDTVDGRPLPVTPGENSDLNGFAHALLCCTAEQLRVMNLNVHIRGSAREEESVRSGSKSEACEILILTLTRHLSPDGMTKDPILLEDVVTEHNARKSFEAWTLKNVSRERVALIRKCGLEALEAKKKRANKLKDAAAVEFMVSNTGMTVEEATAAVKSGAGDLEEGSEEAVAEDPTRWDDSRLNTATAVGKDSGMREAEREKSDTLKERSRLEEEKQKVVSRDPMGLRGEKFDLRMVQSNRDFLIEQMLKGFEEEEEEETNPMEGLINFSARKDSFLQMLERRGAMIDLDEDVINSDDEEKEIEGGVGSILPTDPDFDPVLFLTLVHGRATYKQLRSGLERLNGKTDNQAQRLQDLVRDNFNLFVRCADGIEVFAEQAKDDDINSKSPSSVTPVNPSERIDKLDSLAERCSVQAKKSFKPLLDNTTEVRKTQSALAVLHRVSPLLQIPTLMRQHIEAGRFSAAVKAYRRVLVIGDDCNVEILRYVKSKASEAARDARKDLNKTLSNAAVPVSTLLDAIRDLGELNELDMEEDDNDDSNNDNPPALACLLVQSSHFASLVETLITNAESMCKSIFDGDSSVLQENDDDNEDSFTSPSDFDDNATLNTMSTRRHRRWRYDVLEARVRSTVRSVEVARTWLPRLLRIGIAAKEAERREAARTNDKAIASDSPNNLAFEIFSEKITPAVNRLVQHASFCALGSGNRKNHDDLVPMTFGRNIPQTELTAILKTPLPPKESSKCSTQLANLVHTVKSFSDTASTLQSNDTDTCAGVGLQTSNFLAESALITLERRRCIFAFDICSRQCSRRASNSGMLDGDALLLTLQSLSDHVLTRPEDCSNEIERGCQLVIRKCCEGLADYVRDRGDAARLRALAECADVLSGRALDVVREVAYLTNGTGEKFEEAIVEDILSLEATLFQDFLEGVKRSVTSCVKFNWLALEGGAGKEDKEDTVAKSLFPEEKEGEGPAVKAFPGYLSASLLAIVRCRAQVERALGDTTVRRPHQETYLALAMRTAADSVLQGIVNEVNEKLTDMTEKQADRMANELQFLSNTLRTHLGSDAMALSDQCRRMLTSKAGRVQWDGPDGLTVIEELERLGRVYVMCLEG